MKLIGGMFFPVILCLISIGACFHVTDLPNLHLHFSENCSDYFVFIDNDNYAYMNREAESGKINLLLSSGNMNYSLYSHEVPGDFIFGLTTKTINKEKMDLISSEGSIELHPNYTSVHIMCPILGLRAGSLDEPCNSLSPVYKCDEYNQKHLWFNNIVYCLTAFVVLFLLGTNHENIKRVLGPSASRFFQRSRQVLSRSS